MPKADINLCCELNYDLCLKKNNKQTKKTSKTKTKQKTNKQKTPQKPKTNQPTQQTNKKWVCPRDLHRRSSGCVQVSLLWRSECELEKAPILPHPQGVLSATLDLSTVEDQPICRGRGREGGREGGRERGALGKVKSK